MTFIVATGGTVTTDGDYKIHTFNSSADFVVTSVGDDPTYGDKVWYLNVAGGGGGGGSNGGSGSATGGGAGGYRTNAAYDFTVTATTYAITIGAGGIGNSGAAGASGNNSVFSTITSTGGGGGVPWNSVSGVDIDGGSGGGGGTVGGSGTAGQGNDGGAGYVGGSNAGGGGGGGAGAVGANGISTGGGNGGAGSSSTISGAAVTRGGGGGGGSFNGGTPGTGGSGGGGAGTGTGVSPAFAGTANTGGGGGGAAAWPSTGTGGAGGSGVVIIRYKFQAAPVADFSGTPTTGTAPLNVDFTDLSTNTPTSWAWTFGDGDVSSDQNPSHTYAAGTYTVGLTATNAAGSDLDTKTDYITVTAVADTTDTHDGIWRQRLEISKEKVDERVKTYRQRREKLHEDIRFAMDGPAEQPVIEAIRDHITPDEYDQLGAPDFMPHLKGLMSQTEGLRQIARAVLAEHQRLEDEDDEDSAMLLLQ